MRPLLLAALCVLMAASPACRRQKAAAVAAPAAEGSVEVGGTRYTLASDPASILKRAEAVFSYQIEKFHEEKGRFPTSLAEARLDTVPLPPGKQVVYNPATGKCTLH